MLKSKFASLTIRSAMVYIKLGKLFKVAAESLQQKGYLLVCDYFVLDGAEGIFTRSGHPYDKFMNRAAEAGFSKRTEEDITDAVLKTLQMGQMAVDKLMLTLDIITEKARKDHPHLLRFLKWAFRKKIRKYNRQIQLLDAEQFRKYKTYRFLLFQLNGNPNEKQKWH